MSKELDDNLKEYLEKLALACSPFGAVDGQWDSSAKKLEQDLAARGIKMKLYYKYALPEGMTPQEFMVRIAVLDLCAGSFDSFWVKKEIFFDKSLGLVDKFRLVKYIAAERQASREKINEYVKFIQHANPELSGLKISNRFHPFNILAGAAFGFGPKEIEYFITDYRGMRQGGKDQELHSRIESFGIFPNYVLAPETANVVISELEKHAAKKKTISMVKVPNREGIRAI